MALSEREARARAEVRAIVKRSGTSFDLGMRVLSRRRREAMHALYAFCRVVDDIGDGDAAPDAKRKALDRWRDEIDRLYAGAPVAPVAVALARPVAEFALDRGEFERIVDGVEKDAAGPIRAPARAELAEYCRCVAGAVGMLSMPIFGAPRGQASDVFAVAMGEGLQLANIVRDVAEDAGVGRVYLPRELLDRFGLPEEPAALLRAPRLADARAALAEEALARMREALALAPTLGWRVVRPALMMGAAYKATLDALARDRFRRLERPRFSSVDKLAIAARALLAPPPAHA